MKRAALACLPSADRADVERGRVLDPIVRAEDLAFVTLEKDHLGRAEAFYGDFGLALSARTADALYLRGAGPVHHCLVVRQASRPRFAGFAFRVGSELDLRKLASLPGASPVEDARDPGGGLVVRLASPGGVAVSAVFGTRLVAPRPVRAPLAHNPGDKKPRVNASQRAPLSPPDVLRFGHVAVEARRFFQNLLWYMRTFGLIVSDYQWLEEAPRFGPVMAFMRCDRGREPCDHHSLALAAGLDDGLAHAAFEVQDLDAVALGGEHLRRKGWRRAWGVGRHILGSQIFDYWRDPDGVMVEHYTDGDVYDASVPTGRLPFRGSNLAQWGPPLPRDFIDAGAGPRVLAKVIRTLRGNPETSLGKLAATARALAS